MATPDEILNRLTEDTRAGLTARSVKIWAFIYSYIERNQYADSLDEDFVSEVREQFGISPAAISSHLRRMSKKKLLLKWVGTVRPGQIKHSLIIFNDSLPTRFVRYTLPGVTPPNTTFRD